MISTPSEPRTIDAKTLQERLATSNSPRVLDVRTPAEFEAVHIPGSYNVPLATLREHRDELRHHLDTDVVLVCLAGGRAQQAEKALSEVGLPGLCILEGGMRGWQDIGGQVARGRQIWDIERQVRFVAGGIVAASVTGSLAVPRLKWLAASVGAGLVGAALTNSCVMGNLLAKMPWNRGDGERDVREVFRALAESA